jgi:urease alpha subunit
LSLHQELELLVLAGLSPLKALQAATITPAELMRMSGRLGAVEVGKVGDLVILDANPMENIRNTRKIWRIVSRGKVFDGKYNADFVNPIPRLTPLASSHFFPASANPGRDTQETQFGQPGGNDNGPWYRFYTILFCALEWREAGNGICQ